MANKSDVRKRDIRYSPKLETDIIFEKANDSNPFLVDEILYHGFEHFDLMANVSFTDMIFLLLNGELPTPEQSDTLRKLSVAVCNPGIRHAATQAAMATGTGRTDRLHILPISLGIFSGEFEAAGGMDSLIKDLLDLANTSLQEAAHKVSNNSTNGFGTLYGDKDPYAEKLLQYFCESPTLPLLQKLNSIQAYLSQNNVNSGILKQGVVAAVLHDLGFSEKQFGPVFQLLSAPGLLAHGMEYSEKPMSAMLFESDEQYEWQK